jgi:ABC-type nitrate/sulfonate/bicarbonate transport system substrate-binding protein
MHKSLSRWLVLVVFVFLSPLAHAATPSKVVILPSGLSEREGVLAVAKDHGLFRKYDIQPEIVHVRSGAVAISAVAAGEAQFYYGSASGATLGAVANGVDIVLIAGLINKLTGVFMVAPDIKSPADLKGKRIGVTSIGGGNWMFAVFALEHWGLDIKRNGIGLRVIGDNAVLTQSLISGAIDGCVVSYTFATQLKRQGFRSLADLANLGIPYQGNGMWARRGFINQSPDIVDRTLKSLIDAVGFIQEPGNKALVMTSLAKWLHLPRPEDAAESYELMKAFFERRIYPNVDGIRNTIRVVGSTDEKIRRLKAEDVVDDTAVKRIEKAR